MADKKPLDPKKSGKKSSWLSTNDWLGVAPAQTPMPPAAPGTDDAIGGEMHSEGSGSVLPLGREERELANVTPSSAIIARADLADQTAIDDDDDAIDLATPPGGATTGPPSLSKILKATGTKSDIIRGGKPDSGDAHMPIGPGSGWLAGNRPPPKSGGSRVDIGNSPRTTDDASDIFTGARSDADATGSNLLPGMSGIGRSSVFGDSRAGSSGLGGGAESDLFAGLTGVGDRGSSLYDDSANKTQRVSPDADIFSTAPVVSAEDSPSDVVRLMGEDLDATELDARPIQSGPPSSAKLADRLLAGLADSGGYAKPDFDTLDKSQSGSNLFDDVTAMDIDLGSEAGNSGTSGVDWLDPNRAGAQDSGPSSSIFQKLPVGEATDPGRVDLSHIPMMGSTDDSDEMVQNSDLAGPPSSILKKELQKAMRELKAEGGVSFDLPDTGDDGRIAWGTPQETIDPQYSMRMQLSDDELDLAAPAPSGSVLDLTRPKRVKKESDSVFDDVIEMPDESGILVRNAAPLSSPMLQGMTSDKMQYQAEPAPPTRAKSPSTSRDLAQEPRSKRGWLIAAAALLAGTGVGAAGMYFVKPADTSKPIATRDDGTPVAANTPSVIEATRLLDNGDILRAKEMFNAVKDDTPESRAGRGQARWMERLREVASDGKKLPSTDNVVNIARADLLSVFDRADTLKTPEQQRAGLRAALNLGLIAEATGKPNDAIKIYEDASAKLPAFKRVFDASAQRVKVMLRKPDNGVVKEKDYVLAPETLWELADANRILLHFDPVQAFDDEPGFYFWEAVQFATQWETAGAFDKAIASLDKARETHLKRRSKLIGMGLNPLSDPTEQMFVRACDELRFYWQFKKTLYNDPAGMALVKSTPAARGNFTEGMLKDLLEAKKNFTPVNDQLVDAKKKAAEAEAAAKDAIKARDTAQIATKSLLTDRDNLAAQVASLSKNLATAKATASAAADKVKAAEAAFDPLIAKLKTAKLVDENATREQVLAALPKITLTASGPNADLAKELATLNDRYTTEKADAAKKIAALETAAKELDVKAKDEMAKALEAVRKESAARVAAVESEARSLKDQAEAARRDFEKKAREMAEAHQRDMASVRAGATVTLSDGERAKLDQASRAFANGLDAYFASRSGEAEAYLRDAVAKNANDARYWYFLGLTKYQQGRSTEAAADFKTGAALEARGLPSSGEIGNLLISVQGGARTALDAARP